MEVSLPKIKKFSKNSLKKNIGKISWIPEGKVLDVVGTIVEANLPKSKLGMVAEIESPSKQPVFAEVVGFKGDRSLLIPYSHLSGISSGASVKPHSLFDQIPVGDFLLGQVLDPFFKSLTSTKLKVPENATLAPLEKEAPNPMERQRIESQLPLGIRSLDGILTFGEGQRTGIFAGSGVGKSVLLGMIAKGGKADINVIGLIGERGREVREFLERDLGAEGLKKSIVVCVTSDQSPLMRLRAANMVTAIAEYFSGRGKKVLLMMDSLTRVAQAQREIGLAVGEPPTSKGYPPSVYSLLPRLLERCGPQAHGKGSISGLYTVLVDGDDFNDPIPDAARGILDGHINLSRDLATKGHFPAIEVNTSASRVMRDIVSKEHWQLSLELKELLGVYESNIDFIQLGQYQHGTNPKLDRAIKLMPEIEKYLRQDVDILTSPEEAISGLLKINKIPIESNDQFSSQTQQ
jgi:flagellum-specific ATP synthase